MGCDEVFPAMQYTSCPIMNRCSAIAQPVFPDEAFCIARTESIGALVAPRVIATFLLFLEKELTRLDSLDAITLGDGCFLLPSFSSSTK